jgi:alpha-N-arabinofuranosidase
MAQGTRVTRNLLHDNKPREDLFVEVNHGPFLIEHNLFLSPIALFDMSQGGAYVHNLFAGRIAHRPELRRQTPFHPPHSTKVAGLRNIQGGDDRFYNNIFVNHNGLASYDKAAQPVQMAGNVFIKGAQSSKGEQDPVVRPQYDPEIKLVEEKDGVRIHITLDKTWAEKKSRRLVTTALLGRAKIPDLAYEQADGSPYRIDTDYFGRKRNTANPFPGPFELPIGGRHVLRVRPVSRHTRR